MTNKSEFEEFQERFFEHLPEFDDITLVVLKGHLLIEEQLDNLLEKTCESPESLEKVRLSFYQKIQLLKALYTKDLADKSNMQPWAALESLNTIRNKLSHHLEPNNLEAVIETFVNSFGIGNANFKCEEQNKTTKTFRLALCYLSGYVTAIQATKTSSKKPSNC